MSAENSDGDNPIFSHVVGMLREGVEDDTENVQIPIIDDILERYPRIEIPEWKEPTREPIDSPNAIPVVIFVIMALIILIFVGTMFTGGG